MPIEVDYEYRLCLRMEKDAKLEGRTFGDVFARKTTGKDVENLFAGLGASFLRDKSLFKGNGECIEEAFSEEQRRIIYWIAGRLARGYLRKTRRNRKRYDAGDE